MSERSCAIQSAALSAGAYPANSCESVYTFISGDMVANRELEFVLERTCPTGGPAVFDGIAVDRDLTSAPRA